MLEIYLAIFSGLPGYSAMVSLVVNILKFKGVIADGYSARWVAGFNLVGVLAVYVATRFFPEFQLVPIDTVLMEIATVGGFIFAEVLMIFGSRITHEAVKGIPLVGKSFTVDKERMEAE